MFLIYRIRNGMSTLNLKISEKLISKQAKNSIQSRIKKFVTIDKKIESGVNQCLR